MNDTLTNALPNIPRLYTAISEWLGCVVYLSVINQRVPLHRSVPFAIVGLPVLVVVQYLDGMMSIAFWIFGMLLAFGCMYLIVFLAGGTGKREGLYLTARAFVLAELVASLHWQLVMFASADSRNDGIAWPSLGIVLAAYAVCFSLAWLAERDNFSRTKPTSTQISTVVATVSIAIVTFAMSNLSFVSTNTPFSGIIGQEVFYIRTLVDFCGFAILYAQQEQSRQLAANIELASIETRLQSQHHEYLQSKENVETLGRITHDLKHQIIALRAEMDPQRVSAGFEQLETSVQHYGMQQHSGNPVLDVILTSKAHTFAEHAITFTAVADGKLLSGMSSMDIATLFGNALDNAIEAVSPIGDAQRRLIRLALYARNQFIVISVENYFDSPLNIDNEGNLRTTKRKGAGRHGFGVKSIQHIAHQYGGEATIRATDHWFTLTVLLPRR